MKKAFVLVALLLVSVAFAEEVPVNSTNGSAGVNAIVSVAGADTTNASTATPFFIPTAAKITIWCNAAAYIAISSRVAANATGNGVPVAASTLFPTSTGSTITSQTANASLGGAIVRIFGAGAVTCYVYVRRGTE